MSVSSTSVTLKMYVLSMNMNMNMNINKKRTKKRKKERKKMQEKTEVRKLINFLVAPMGQRLTFLRLTCTSLGPRWVTL